MISISQPTPNVQPIEPVTERIVERGGAFDVTALTPRCLLLEHEGRYLGQFRSWESVRRFLRYAIEEAS